MKRIREIAALLKEYGRLSSVILSLSMTAFVLVYGFCTDDPKTMFFICLPLLLVWWEISDVYLYRERDSLKHHLLDKEDETIMLKGKNRLLQEELDLRKKLAGNHKDNPIRSNRIVSDITFAVRLKSFIEEVNANDPMSEEEKIYLHGAADRLLSWQTKTVRKDSKEYKYLERLGLMPQPSANAEEYTEDTPKEEKPKRRESSKKKNKTTENENKD